MSAGPPAIALPLRRKARRDGPAGAMSTPPVVRVVRTSEPVTLRLACHEMLAPPAPAKPSQLMRDTVHSAARAEIVRRIRVATTMLYVRPAKQRTDGGGKASIMAPG